MVRLLYLYIQILIKKDLKLLLILDLNTSYFLETEDNQF